jgi:hypothetical protein
VPDAEFSEADVGKAELFADPMERGGPDALIQFFASQVLWHADDRTAGL